MVSLPYWLNLGGAKPLFFGIGQFYFVSGNCHLQSWKTSVLFLPNPWQLRSICTHCYIQNGQPKRTYCIAPGTLLNIMWQPGWEGSWGENKYMYMYGWVTLLSTWSYHNSVNWLYSSKKLKKIHWLKCLSQVPRAQRSSGLSLLGELMFCPLED